MIQTLQQKIIKLKLEKGDKEQIQKLQQELDKLINQKRWEIFIPSVRNWSGKTKQKLRKCRTIYV